MQTTFITTEIELIAPPAALHDAIEIHLRQQGEPLRWAIVSVDRERQTVAIEAVIVLESACL